MLIPIVFLAHVHCFGQIQDQNDSLNIRMIEVAKEIMRNAGTCALITIDEEGLPRVRTMDPFPPEEDLTVWFGTNPRSRKVHQIINNPDVILYYFDSSTSGYVVIHGDAQLINDPEEKEKWWKDEWQAFYSNKEEAYMLIKVVPVWMEVLSNAHGIFGDPITWQPPHIVFNHQTTDDE